MGDVLVQGVPVIYADDIGSVEVIGGRVRIIYVEFRRIGADIVSVPVAEMIRPLESIGCGKLLTLVQAAIEGVATRENVVRH